MPLNAPDDPIPLVIVEGFLGGSQNLLWGGFEEYLNPDCRITKRPRRRIIYADVGPVSSLHDRACELFYSIIGGTVNYGDTHSKQHQHEQYARNVSPGSYPQWSTKLPLHFLGHSMGGPTILKLQWLIKHGFFGPQYTPDMFLSINTVSAMFRGTQLVYILGEREDAAPAVKYISVGSMIARIVHILSYFSPMLPTIVDLHAESRKLSYTETSLRSFLKQMWHSDWAESRDAAPFDATFEAAEEREAFGEGYPHEKTYYSSFSARMSMPSDTLVGEKKLWPRIKSSIPFPLFYLTAHVMERYDFSRLRPTPAWFVGHKGMSGKAQNADVDAELGKRLIVMKNKNLGSEHWENDGVVPAFSQWHPFPCSETRCSHDPILEGNLINQTPSPGIWLVHEIPESSHISLVPVWLGTTQQKQFWRTMQEHLISIDDIWLSQSNETIPLKE